MEAKVLRKSELETYSAPGLTGIWIGPGTKAKVGKFTFEKGKKVPPHSHEKTEQISHVLKGKLKVVLNEQEFMVSEGESYLVPPGTKHSMEAQEETVSVDVYAPPHR